MDSELPDRFKELEQAFHIIGGRSIYLSDCNMSKTMVEFYIAQPKPDKDTIHINPFSETLETGTSTVNGSSSTFVLHETDRSKDLFYGLKPGVGEIYNLRFVEDPDSLEEKRRDVLTSCSLCENRSLNSVKDYTGKEYCSVECMNEKLMGDGNG